MSAIKRFFERRKIDVKFKKAGGGHKLTEETRAASTSGTQRPSSTSSKKQSKDACLTAAQRAAAEAALQRQHSHIKPASGVGTGSSAIKLQVKRELEAERKAHADAAAFAGPTETYHESAPVLAVSGVYFSCPMLGDEALPKKEMEDNIYTFFLSQLAEEPVMTSALMIQTLNKDHEKVKVCVDTLCKYLDNIIGHPGEDKYRKIRLNNKAFQDRIADMMGAHEYIQSIGFEQKSLPGPNDTKDDFYVLPAEKSDPDQVTSVKEILLMAEPIKPELNRNTKVYYPSSKANQMGLPQEFFNYTSEELKKEQEMRSQAVEKLGMLRTKEMRERERLKELRRYRYSLIRVRMPDGNLLQGTFRATEKVSSLYDFVRKTLQLDWIPFTLSSQTGHKLTEESSTLAESDLVPAVVVNFSYDEQVLKEMTAQQGSHAISSYLKPELMASIKAL